jgi:hypothetical protein
MGILVKGERRDGKAAVSAVLAQSMAMIIARDWWCSYILLCKPLRIPADTKAFGDSDWSFGNAWLCAERVKGR